MPDLLEGWVQWGRISIRWHDGVPLEQDRTQIGRGTIAIPAAFWAAVIGNARQDQWAPFAYIAGLESDYVENADIVDSNNYHSRGALQVDGVWPQYDNDSMLHYGPNIAAGQVIYDAQGYGAWFTSAGILGLPGGAPQQPAPGPAPVTPTPPATSAPQPGDTFVVVTMHLDGLHIVSANTNDQGDVLTVIGNTSPNPQP